MKLLRALGTLCLLGIVAWAAWWIAWYAGVQTSGPTVPPPPNPFAS